jgi:hypothetical protein
MRIRNWHLCTTALITCLGVAGAARGAVITVVDVIPNAASGETGQNSEPSLAVNPLNPNTMISGTFTSGSTPYWISTNGGTTWSSFGSLSSVDKSLAWEQSGAAALTTTLTFATGTTTQISTFQSGASSFNPASNVFNPGRGIDQPWIRTGPGGQTYVTYNNLGPGFTLNPTSAAMIVSANNGSTYAAPITLETVPAPAGQDAPSVRSAVNGSTVYAAFTRWGTASGVTGGDIFSGSQVVVVKSINSGASFSAGATAATTTGYFSTSNNSPLTLGQERTGSDVAIAVDPNNPNRVVVAYGDRTGAGLLQLKVVESTNGGLTWSSSKFTTSSAVRSALPGLTILANGDIGLLYASYDPIANSLSQHLVTTTDDFATFTDSLLGTESNTTPGIVFNPYVGDFYDLTSVSNTFYGIFSASNDDNGTLASYPSAVFQRNFTGTPDTASFQLKDLSNNNVALSIDPFVFSFTLNNVVVPEPGTLTLLGASLLGLAALRRRRQ